MYALFDAERIEAVRKEKEVDRKRMLEFNFKYLIGVSGPDPEIGVLELIVDAKTSAKIDAYLSEVIYVLDIQILRTPKGIRYKIEPFEHCPSVSGISTVMHIVEKYNISLMSLCFCYRYHLRRLTIGGARAPVKVHNVKRY
jgi:hypothetical protein